MSKKSMKRCPASLVTRKIPINHKTWLHTPRVGETEKNGNPGWLLVKIRNNSHSRPWEVTWSDHLGQV